MAHKILRRHHRLPREKHGAKALRHCCLSHGAPTAQTPCFPEYGSHGQRLRELLPVLATTPIRNSVASRTAADRILTIVKIRHQSSVANSAPTKYARTGGLWDSCGLPFAVWKLLAG
jgi:hypothetical protein